MTMGLQSLNDLVMLVATVVGALVVVRIGDAFLGLSAYFQLNFDRCGGGGSENALSAAKSSKDDADDANIPVTKLPKSKQRSAQASMSSYEQFVKAKNSNAGPSVFNMTPTSIWASTALGISNVRGPDRLVHVPDVIPAFVLRGVFSPEECKALITCLPLLRDGPGYMPPGDVQRRYRDRIVHRYLVDDQALAEVAGKRIGSFMPRLLDGGQFCGLSPLWRMLHYEKGGHQGCHIDGREPGVPELRSVAASSDEKHVWIQSRLTVQIYLNNQSEEFEGGALSFFDTHGKSKVQTLAPLAGDCVVFYQEASSPYYLLHEGGAVMSGNKYSIRTMANYAFPSEEAASTNTIRTDTTGPPTGAPPAS